MRAYRLFNKDFCTTEPAEPPFGRSGYVRIVEIPGPENMSRNATRLASTTQENFSALFIETTSQDSIPIGVNSLEPLYESIPSHKQAHCTVDHAPDEIVLMVAEWDTPANSKVRGPCSTEDCFQAAVSNIDFEPSRRMLTSAHPPPPSKFRRAAGKSTTI